MHAAPSDGESLKQYLLAFEHTGVLNGLDMWLLALSNVPRGRIHSPPMPPASRHHTNTIITADRKPNTS